MLKSLLRTFLVNLAAFWVLSHLTPVMMIDNYQSLILLGGGLTLVNVLVRPVLKLITLPLNVLTLGLFSGFLTLAILYFVIRITPGVSVAELVIPSFSRSGFAIPEIHISRLAALVVISFGISFIHKIAALAFE